MPQCRPSARDIAYINSPNICFTASFREYEFIRVISVWKCDGNAKTAMSKSLCLQVLRIIAVNAHVPHLVLIVFQCHASPKFFLPAL